MFTDIYDHESINISFFENKIFGSSQKTPISDNSYLKKRLSQITPISKDFYLTPESGTLSLKPGLLIPE